MEVSYVTLSCHPQKPILCCIDLQNKFTHYSNINIIQTGLHGIVFKARDWVPWRVPCGVYLLLSLFKIWAKLHHFGVWQRKDLSICVAILGAVVLIANPLKKKKRQEIACYCETGFFHTILIFFKWRFT